MLLETGCWALGMMSWSIFSLPDSFGKRGYYNRIGSRSQRFDPQILSFGDINLTWQISNLGKEYEIWPLMLQKSWNGGGRDENTGNTRQGKGITAEKHLRIIQGRIDPENPEGWGEFWLLRNSEGLLWSIAMLFSTRLFETFGNR